MVSILLAAALTTAPVNTARADRPTLSMRVRDPKVIRAAVDAALVDDAPGSTAAMASRYATGDTILRGAAYEDFARTMADARVPDCLHPDGLKRQFVPIGGIYSAPFVLIAKLRGKCN